MKSEPNSDPTVVKSVKIRKSKSPIIKLLLIFWGSLFCFILMACVIPSWRSTALFKIWSLNNWQEKGWAYEQILTGGPSTVRVIAPHIYKTMGVTIQQYGNVNVFQRTLIKMDDSALPGIWQLAATDTPYKFIIDEDLIYGILKKRAEESDSEALLDSIRLHIKDEDPKTRRIAILLSCTLLDVKQQEWIYDKDIKIASSMIYYFWREKECVDNAIKQKSKLLETLLTVAVKKNLDIEPLSEEVKAITSLEGFDETNIPIQLAKMMNQLKTLKKDVELLNKRISIHKEDLKKLEGDELSFFIYWLSLQKDKQDEEFIFKNITHENEEVRYRVLFALLEIGHKGITDDLWRIAHEDKSNLVKHAAWKIIAKSPNKKFLPQIRKHVKELIVKLNDRHIEPSTRNSLVTEIKQHIILFSKLGELEDVALLEPLIEDYDIYLHQIASKVKENIESRLKR